MKILKNIIATAVLLFSVIIYSQEVVPETYINPLDIDYTLAELTVQSISMAIRQHVPETEAIYVCGGGAYNSYLMTRLKEELGGIRVADIATLGLKADRVEAMAFAWLARRTMLNLHGNLPEVTGAESELILGGIYKA